MTETVLIVGAGPVGLTMALELARYRVPVRVIDKMTERAETSRAIAIWPRTLELFDRAGGSGEFTEAGNKVTTANIIAGTHPLTQMSLDEVDSPYRFVLMLPQNETEAILLRRLEKLGVAVEMGVALDSFSQDSQGVSVTVRHPGGFIESEQFGWLIGCDGAHSSVRHGLGLSFDGDVINTDWALGDFYLFGAPFGLNELTTYWHRDGPIIFFPMAPGRYRIIASLGPSGDGAPATLSRDEFQELVDSRAPVGIKLDNAVWISAFRINERQVPTYGSGRVFLAGDAAHIHSPAGGQGMNTGMQDAFNLAWKLALTARGLTTSPALLESYSPERHAVGAEVIAAAGRMTTLALAANPVLQELRNVALRCVLGLPPVRNMLAEQMAEISTGYPKSSLNGPGSGSHQKPGMRMRPVDGEAPYGSGDIPLFTLRTNEAPPITHALVDPAVRPNAGTGIDLVRPDGYLATSVSQGEWDVVAAYLDRLT
jgi:2-polyprenyl-6-methoxyphenol hydroxylase-like FAD-dependent oxidoreductase